MKFEESDFMDLTNIPKIFIYFLLDDKNVVYVGQTENGLKRVYEHYRDKIFDMIYIIECDLNELDYLENFYILKYMPKYNKIPNIKCTFSISKLVRKLNFHYKTNKFNKPLIKKILKELDVILIMYKNNSYVDIETYYEIINCIDDYKKGAPLNEIFDIRF